MSAILYKGEWRLRPIRVDVNAYSQPFGQDQMNQPKRIRQRSRQPRTRADSVVEKL